MLNTKIMMDLDNKLNNINTSSKKEVFKKEVSKNDTEVKSDFKDYLSKEVKSDTSRDSINSTYVQKDDKVFISNEEISQSQNEIEDILSEVSNKLDELIDSEYFLGNESDIDALSEILILLSSFLNKNLGNEDLSNEVLNNSYNNFSSLNDPDLNNIQNLFLTLFNSKDDTKTENPLSNLELLRTNSSDDIDIKGLLKNVKELTDNILEDINLNLFDTNTIDDYKNELSNKIISLLESLPNESIKKIYSNIKDEDRLKILSTLLLQKVSNEDNSIEKSTSDSRIAVKDDLVDKNFTSLDKDVTKEKNFNDNNSLKQNSLDENNDEDIILSKIIDSDNKSSFSKVLTYYDKFNKNNIEIIKEPVTVNRQTLDLDIIKNVKFMMKNSVQELKVKIYPKELGEMTIKILSEEGIMRAEIKATSKETYNLLNSNLNEIKKSLVDQNIKIQQVNIGIYNETENPLSNLELLRTNSSDDIDIKGLLKNVKELTDNILEDINLNLFDTNTIDDYKNELSNKIISLLESLPNESIKKIYSNIKDEDRLKILSTLLLQKVSNEDNSIEKSTSDSRIAVKDDLVDKNFTSLDKDVTKEKNFNDNNSLKQNSLDENNDEDIILSKIIDSDNKSSFSKVLTYYDKFNKNNIEIIKEPVTVNRQTLDLDIIKNVKFMMKNSVQELKVKIYPKELGEMTIKILSEEGIMRAEIKATSKETYNLLNSNLNEIKKSLVDQNIKIQQVNIGIYNEDTTFFSGKENSSDNFRNQNSSENSNNSIFIEEEEVKEDLLNESNVNLLA